jgi:crossover junction endodeoxyribonuclease RuvC
MPRYRSKSWRAYQSEAPRALANPAPSAQPVVLDTRARCRILGIDPGSRRLGYGVIEVGAGETRCIAQGRIEVDGLPIVDRLARIHRGVRELIEHHAPGEVAVEKVFVNRNVDSALKLGQARGAALAALEGLEIAEYAPRAIKLATVGYGGADKLQVAHRVRAVLALTEKLTADAADALAVALCHAQHRRLASLVAASAPRGRVREAG